MTFTIPSASSQQTAQYVYPFGVGLASPPLNKQLLGGKGKGLAEMASIGLPVPPGLIITTAACNDYRHSERHLSQDLQQQIYQGIKILEEHMGAQFGSENKPLLVSVRSGARVSMPGMMDTILDLGLNDRSVIGFAATSHSDHLAYDSYRRFITMYANIVKGVPRRYFDQAFDLLKMRAQIFQDQDLTSEQLQEACQLFKCIYEQHVGAPFPQDAYEQLFEAIAAVFNSWDSERACLYRQLNHIPEEWGTAVNVQAMVFGNRNDRSATGVAFTRDPATGHNHFYGEFLLNAQGEEVVAGIRTPHPLNRYQQELSKSSLPSLEELMPEVYQQLLDIVHRLEKYYRDMQDIEFTIDDGRLFMLQTRTGKRTGFAAVRMAIEMLDEGVIDEREALKRVQPDQLTQLLAPIFDLKEKAKSMQKKVAHGLNAGPGAASGILAFSNERAIECKKQGCACILVREEASPDDFPGMVAAEGILTIRGGSTSHAAVVARGMGKPCIVGCSDLTYNEVAHTLSASGQTIKEGDPIAIDGTTGEVFFCHLSTSPSEVVQELLKKNNEESPSQGFTYYTRIMALADKYRSLKVRANADSPLDVAIARAFGAEGIGLCRTEHMFMDPQRLIDVRRMFFSIQEGERAAAIGRLLPYQKQDFVAIYRAMNGLPVTIRLLDPPLHEFIPHSDEELEQLAEQMGVNRHQLLEVRASLEENNPMLGHRGCRLGVTLPELTAMQARAIIEAALQVQAEGIAVEPEIMIPLVSTFEELVHQKGIIDQTAQQIFKEKDSQISYTVGTMIELPRACLIADELAQEAQFFSFGTNDLTQTTYGISRDDSAKFVPQYVKGICHPLHPTETLHILDDDPFQVLDRRGVGQLMEIAAKRGRMVRPGLKCGICGEHGGDPLSIAFCHEIGLDYVSCSPYRVPIARLAAAWPNLI